MDRKTMYLVGGAAVALVVLLVLVMRKREAYSNFECVSVYGNQAEYLRCLERKGCKEAYDEKKDEGKLLPLSKEEKCRNECILKLGDFQDCCNVCKRMP